MADTKYSATVITKLKVMHGSGTNPFIDDDDEIDSDVEEIHEFDEYHHSGAIIADQASDVALSMGPVTNGILLKIRSDQDVTLNLQSDSGTDIVLNENRQIVAGIEFTAIFVSNASGSVANIKYFVAGS